MTGSERDGHERNGGHERTRHEARARHETPDVRPDRDSVADHEMPVSRGVRCRGVETCTVGICREPPKAVGLCVAHRGGLAKGAHGAPAGSGVCGSGAEGGGGEAGSSGPMSRRNGGYSSRIRPA
jgi:hypothetical protein